MTWINGLPPILREIVLLVMRVIILLALTSLIISMVVTASTIGWHGLIAIVIVAILWSVATYWVTK